MRRLWLVAVVLVFASCGGAQVGQGAMYRAARRQWLGSGLMGGSAGQNLALPIAVRDLRVGESTDRGKTAGYQAAIADLQLIDHMPSAMVTTKEARRWRAAQSALDRFFKVPKTAPYGSAYECSTGSSKAAAAAWAKEPNNTTSGVVVGPLERAAADLRSEAGRNPCFASAIDDLGGDGFASGILADR